MANVTDKFAASVHGTNPQNLIEYIMRQKIYDSLYWKQYCFGLSAGDVVDKGIELKFVGGMFGEPQKPTEFICLVLKLLQIQPEKDIILEYIRNDDFKYLRLLGAFYLRLVGSAVDVYRYLEPLLNDYRRVRVRDPSGSFSLSYIDEIIDNMLQRDHLFNIALPRLPKRSVLEDTGQLPPRESVLQEEFDAMVEEEKKSIQIDPRYKFTRKQSKREKWKLPSREKKARAGSAYDQVQQDSDHEIRNHDDDKSWNNGCNDDRDRKGVKRDHSHISRSSMEEGEMAQDSMSVEATNELRKKLGLPPLK